MRKTSTPKDSPRVVPPGLLRLKHAVERLGYPFTLQGINRALRDVGCSPEQVLAMTPGMSIRVLEEKANLFSSLKQIGTDRPKGELGKVFSGRPTGAREYFNGPKLKRLREELPKGLRSRKAFGKTCGDVTDDTVLGWENEGECLAKYLPLIVEHLQAHHKGVDVAATLLKNRKKVRPN